MTKKELLEAIKDMPMDAKVEFFDYNLLSGYKAVTSAEYIKNYNIIELC